MTSRPESKARRKSPQDRRAEIVATATRMALEIGLEQLTLRRVAERLGVANSLVSHYFPSVDELLAEAFDAAARQEIDRVYAAAEADPDPVRRVLEIVDDYVTGDRERMATLWLGAWYNGRTRPALHAAVTELMNAEIGRLAALIEAGNAEGSFRAPDPVSGAIRILAVCDGLSIQAVMRAPWDHTAARELVYIVTERELGLPAGTFDAARSRGGADTPS
ncbi:TetR/AcrR family transcriptional regulator [Embleya scabrispora]|nr:TetR family transcriptional regulator C-terminal domain-containing protein [Embleya scabrispora]